MSHLIEIIEGLVKISLHASRWFVGDLDRVLKDALRDDVVLGGSGWFRTDEDAILRVRRITVLF